MRVLVLLPLLLSHFAIGQISSFDSGNEGWTTSGDATSPDATWMPTGGNPGGHIRVTDQSVGGTWHFVAPSKFRGNKCDAYGKHLRYDQFVSDTTNEDKSNSLPDVVLFGGGLTLVYDNASNPQLSWTHYDILLREDAGWRLAALDGPVPTEAQFRAALSDIAGWRIRGEYRPLADFGGLDNVVLESDFGFDLDGDDSSGATNGDFRADTLCYPFGSVADADALLFSEKPIDSVVVKILYASSDEVLELDAFPAKLDIEMANLHSIVLKNAGDATPSDFVLAIQLMHYNDLSPAPLRGERIIEFRVFTECGQVAIRYAYLPIFPPLDAGLDADTAVCAGSLPFDMHSVLKGNPDKGGKWSPTLSSGTNFFDTTRDAAGLYAYFFQKAGECHSDTAYVLVTIEQPFELRADTTICFGDTLSLLVPPGLADWQWGDGTRGSEWEVTAPGTYALSGRTQHCMFSDSVRVAFYTCQSCPFYAPNVFAPNSDGLNAEWRIFLPCAWFEYRLEIFDRWGNLVFIANDPSSSWDGSCGGRACAPGVYVWHLEWVGELFGERRKYLAEGDVTVLR
ncbi:MAG: gliding motility-associated C-terminal domain-containing protein [Saprospiraceae bacterium]|nr:gliding motility-associated C-terminal domain-containing protein [Saprospiraceae bacterium]